MTSSDITSPDSQEKRPRLTFHKGERLHHFALIEGLFREGKTLYEFPLRLTWRVMDSEELKNSFRKEVPSGISPIQMMVTVPKKKRKKAVDRVLMRRRIREAYRLNRLPLRNLVATRNDIRTLQLALVYIHDKNLAYTIVEEKLKILISKMIRILDK